MGKVKSGHRSSMRRFLHPGYWLTVVGKFLARHNCQKWAIRVLEQGMRLFENDFSIMHRLAMLYKDSEQGGKAELLLGKLHALFPREIAILDVFYANGNVPILVSYLMRPPRNVVRDVYFYRERGDIYVALNMFSDAYDNYMTAVGLGAKIEDVASRLLKIFVVGDGENADKFCNLLSRASLPPPPPADLYRCFNSMIFDKNALSRCVSLNLNETVNHFFTNCYITNDSVLEAMTDDIGGVDLEEALALRTRFSPVFHNNSIHSRDGRRRDPCPVGRKIAHAPEKYEGVLYIFGDSRALDIFVEDEYAMASCLQKMINDMSPGTRVLNHAVAGMNEPEACLSALLNLRLSERDKVALFYGPLYPFQWHNHDRGGNSRIFDKWLDFLKAIRRLCDDAGAELIFFLPPNACKIESPSGRERELKEFCCFISGVDPADPGIIRENAHITNILRTNGCRCHDLDRLVQRPHDMGEVFFNDKYVSHRAGRKIAEFVFHAFFDAHEAIPVHAGNCVDLSNYRIKANHWLKKEAQFQFCRNHSLMEWIFGIQDSTKLRGDLGCIVMNCNPFTLGHKYLIEKALEKVDGLFIFVVEEDRSDFPFADRIELVRSGTKDFGDRVEVYPSGEFIISNMTFGGYFTKAAAAAPADSTCDVLLFASIIAPMLNIKHRFVGEEPVCIVTNSYNERMRYFLPDLDIDFQVVPRKEDAGVPISASSVRAALADNDHELVKRLVPETTYAYLIEKGKITGL